MCGDAGVCSHYGRCECNSCFSGEFCDSLCSGHGNCNDGLCSCEEGWRGELCSIAGCPGEDIDCSGNGVCNAAIHLCYCNPGWAGADCSVPDCAGDPDCNGNGQCSPARDPPECVCSTGWMGRACEEECLHGNATVIDGTFICMCEPCWVGQGCNVLCSGYGACNSEEQRCDCDPMLGWRGDFCQIPGCPGIGTDCSGHGDCNSAIHECTCYPGWSGVACHEPDCPGEPDCYDRGFCNTTRDPPTCTNCSVGYMGSDCNEPCVKGIQQPMDSGICVCDPGWVGTSCDSECSGHGKVVNNVCHCDFDSGWRGEFCDNPGCPGIDVDCSDHGSCDSSLHICTCDPGWRGIGCHEPDCPGEPDCNGRGTCNDTFDPPRCLDCEPGVMGPACEDPCIHGVQDPPNSGFCNCSQGYTGVGCDAECCLHGTVVNGECQCDPTWWGSLCCDPGCPGVGSPCSNRGECNAATHICQCDIGYKGEGCEHLDCPGDPDCFDRGTCTDDSGSPRCVNCSWPYIGHDCNSLCQFGREEPADSGNCVCDPCFAGSGCNSECSGNGRCYTNPDTSERECSCDSRWRGPLCNIPGCPGEGKDCSGNGDCNTAVGICFCFPGWTGEGCDIPDCPGEPDCNEQGQCLVSEEQEAICACSDNHFGSECEFRCAHGSVEDSVCTCNECYTGYECNVECSGNGQCESGQCQCTNLAEQAFVGPHCEFLGCPSSCSGHGSCNSGTQECTCYPGWSGKDCSTPDCPGTPSCSGNGVCRDTIPRKCKCHPRWTGTACDVPCSNGNNTHGMGCVCNPCFTGVGCTEICSGNGLCEDGRCACHFETGFRGDRCQIPGCPGNMTDCSGHGSCNTGSWECLCDPGWKGVGCQLPDCPGTPDCSGNGDCPLPPVGENPVCHCHDTYMGHACELRCFHGVPTLINSTWVCACDDCYAGLDCGSFCNNQSEECVDGVCDCGFGGWRGERCDVLGCPGIGADCSNHGQCNLADRTCLCDGGWTGAGCHLPDCPGEPDDCNGRGICLEDYPSPRCVNCSDGWMGPACEIPCVNGAQDPPNSGVCVCEPCFHGVSCDELCSGVGRCFDNGTCDCSNTTGKGSYCGHYCQSPTGLPCMGRGSLISGECLCNQGWAGDCCDQADCPGDPDCNGRGDCFAEVLVPECRNCMVGWMGEACEIPCGPEHGIQRPMDSGICECTDPCWHGLSCLDLCSGRGSCNNATATCDCLDGAWGDFCEILGCRGDGMPCSGHGVCQSDRACLCDEGWMGDGCQIPVCPEECSGYGVCSGASDVPTCECDAHHFGTDCGYLCQNGSVVNSTCQCDPCYAGPACDQECAAHGQCENDTCLCEASWWGPVCSYRGCPGEGTNCTGHGYCNVLQQQCSCEQGWKGVGCEIPDCYGEPDCGGNGYCDGEKFVPPQCVCYSGWMGENCDTPCVNGTESPPRSGMCQCHGCFSGLSCNVECSGRGSCLENGVCTCSEFFKGELCQEYDCPGEPDCSSRGSCVLRDETAICLCDPGFTSENCSEIICPGEPQCSGHGTCTLVGDKPVCICDHGFDGDSCDTCRERFTGDSCERCVENYIGWNASCSIYCLKGVASEVGGDECRCHSNNELGYWAGVSCERCQDGYALPYCRACQTDYVGDCTIRCIEGQGTYSDPNDGSGGRGVLRPFLQCVTPGNETDEGEAWFGYENDNWHNIYIPIGPANHFNQEDFEGQPTKFKPGLHYSAVRVKLNENEEAAWFLTYSPSNTQFSITTSLGPVRHCSAVDEQMAEEEKQQAASDNQCLCKQGYWGPACEFECIGGASNPCYGNGACNSSTGACDCSSAVSPDSANCTTCAAGMFGVDCSIGYSVGPADLLLHFAAAYGPGHFTTFDGALYTYRGEGIHTLIRGSVSLQVQLVTCQARMYATCINAVAFAPQGGRSVVIHAGYTDDEVEFPMWLDGVVANINNSPHLGGSFFIEQESYNHFSIFKTDHVHIDIHLRGRSLDVYVRVVSLVCSATEGLLSSCDGDPFNDFSLSSGETLVQDRNNILSLDQSNIHTIFGPSWKETGTSLLEPIYGAGDYNEVKLSGNSDSGYALYFQDSAIKTTTQVLTFTGPDVTLELDLKPARASSECVAVLSYVLQDTSTLLLCNNYLAVSIGSDLIWTSQIELLVDTWYRVALVWQKSITTLRMYAFQSTTLWSTEIFVFSDADSEFFDPGGTLVLGQWHLPPNYNGPYLYQGFHGWLDEVRIWNTFYFSEDLLARVNVAADVPDHALCNYWTFNEGQGSVIYDIKSAISMQMLPDAWNPPIWKFSSAHIERFEVLTVNAVYGTFWSGSLSQPEARDFCHNLITSSSYDVCNNMETSSYYLSQCIADAALYDTIAFTMEVALVYAAQCENINRVTASPAQSHCNDFPGRRFQGWTGPQCNVPCHSGEGASSCVCYAGYWGSACENFCDGGGGSFACGGVGVCNKDTGDCSCPVSHDSHLNCSSCGVGFYGQDCSLAIVETVNITYPVCSLYGYGHIVTYDGLAFTLNIAGEYHFTKVEDIDVFIRLTPCPGHPTCLTSVWLMLEDANLTIQIPTSEKEELMVILNGERIYPTDIVLPSRHNVSVSFDSFTIYNNISTILITYHLKYFDIQVTTGEKLCQNLTGRIISGNCDRDPSNDIATNSSNKVHASNVTYDLINGPWAEYMALPRTMQTQFVYRLTNHIDAKEITPAGYGLYFNSSSCISEPISNSTFDPNTDLTIEFLVLTLNSEPGCIFAYADGETYLTVSVSQTLLLHFSPGVEFDTEISPEADNWGFISLIYHRDLGGCTLAYVSTEKNITGVSINIGTGFFMPGGTVLFGTWPTTPIFAVPFDSRFEGYIDEVRIWRKAFDLNTVWYNIDLNLQGSNEDIVALWKFSEGAGLTAATDSIHGSQLVFSSTAAPVYAICGAPVEKLDTYFDFPSQIYHKFSSADSYEEAYGHCKRIVFYEGIIEACSSLGPSIGQFFLQNCVYNSSVQGSDITAYITARMYSSYCMATLALPMLPSAALCKNVSTNPEAFFALGCTVGSCNFGTRNLVSGQCDCLEGYWGTECDGVCPGGHENPCNRQGFCDRDTGECQCLLTWSQTSNCTECAGSWTGDNCSIALPDPSETIANKTCSVFGQGHFVTFDGAQYDFKEYGEYLFYQYLNVNLEVQLRIIPCYQQTSCVVGVAVSYQGDALIIRAGYTSESNAIFWFNAKETQLTHLQQTFGNIIVQQPASGEYHIKALDESWDIHVRTIDRYLNAIFSLVVADECATSTGLCGSCDNADMNDFYSVEDSRRRWWISDNSLFNPIYESTVYNERRDLTGAGYGILFNDSFLQSQRLNLELSAEITLEFFFTSIDNNGVLLSCGSQITFSLFLNGTLRVAVGLELIDTGLVPYAGWNRLVFVLQPSLLRRVNAFVINVYLFDANGLYHTWEGSVFGNPFTSDMYLVLGRWLPGEDTFLPSPVSLPFVGVIDELCIWDKALSLHEVLTRISAGIEPGRSHLLALWKFDEGQGSEAVDLIHHRILDMSFHTWMRTHSQWQFSSAPIILHPPVYTLANPALWSESCVHLFNKMSYQSLYLRVDVFLVACARDYAMSISNFSQLAVILGFSDLYLLHTTQKAWPAQSLCNSFADINFPLWHGPTCNMMCYFSKAASNDVSVCTCLPGTWGDDCSKECDGGISTACNNHGVCSVSTGLCQCEPNWIGKDCSQCAPGWFGTDCSISSTSTPGVDTSRCSFFVSGYITTFDSSSLQLPVTDDFNFYTTTELAIHIRQIPCSGLSSCVTAIGFDFGSTQMLIGASTSQESDPVILVDNSTLSLEAQLHVGSTDYSLVRVAIGEYKLHGPQDFLLNIFSPGAYFNIELVQTGCTYSAGLCGPCKTHQTSCNDSSPICAINAMGLKNYASLYPLSHELSLQYFASYHLQHSHSVIQRMLRAHPVLPLFPSSSGYSLRFRGTGIFSDPLPDTFPINTAVTIQFYTRITDTPGGTLFSVSGRTTLALVIGDDGTFMIFEGTTFLTTTIPVPVGDWLFITLSVPNLAGRLLFYCIDSLGIVAQASFYVTFSESHFVPGASMSIGSWVLPTSGIVPLQVGSFNGEVDSFSMLVGLTMTYNEVLLSWMNSGFHTDVSVSCLLTFNSGKGGVVGGGTLGIAWHLPHTSPNSPYWTASTLAITGNQLPTSFSLIVKFPSGEFESDTVATCTRLLYSGPVNDQCGSLTQSARFHYQSCLQICASSEMLHLSVDSVLDFSGQCKEDLDLLSSPAQFLCKEFTEELAWPFAGDQCDVPCIYGSYTDQCHCLSGYYGSHCSQTCPGGPNNPCYGHGLCHTETGKCLCEWGWKSETNCSTCADGVTGRDCSIVDVGAPNGTMDTVTIMPGTVTSHRGLMFPFNQSGTYQIAQTTHTNEQTTGSHLAVSYQVRQVYLGQSPAISTVSFQQNEKEVTFYHDMRTQEVKVVLDGHEVHFDETLQEVDDFGYTLDITQESPGHYVVASSSGLGLTTELSEGSLGTTLTVAEEACCLGGTWTGLAGPCTCQGAVLNSTYEITPSDSDADIAEKIKNFTVTLPEAFITNNDSVEYVVPGGYAGFSILLNNSLAYSNQVVFVNAKITISLQVRFCGLSCGGVILSYASTSTLVLSVRNSITVYVNDLAYPTDLVIAAATWTQLSLVYDRAAGILQVFLHDSSGHAARRRLELVDSDIMESHGTLAIGHWLPGGNGAPYSTLGHFVGEVDELTLWSRLLDDTELQDLQRASPYSCTPNLEAQWRFDNVQDGVVTDLVSGLALHLSSPGFSPATLQPSTLNLGPPGSGILPSDTPTLDFQQAVVGDDDDGMAFIDACGDESEVPSWIVTFCTDVILSGPIAAVCHLGQGVSREVYSDCVSVSVEANSTDAALSVVVQHADFCQSSLSLTHWPARTLCNKFGEAPFPLWIGDNCDIKCIYGKKAPHNRNICVCDRGYWNRSCDVVCPGGSDNPCNGVGECDISTGECHCPVNWQGAPDCSSCSPGWTGPSCSFALVNIGVNVRIRISVVGLSYISTFTGVTFRFNGMGEYHLLSIAQNRFILQAKFVLCFSGLSCMQQVGLVFGDNTHGFARLTISATGYRGGGMTFRLNNRPFYIDTSATFANVGYTFTRLSLTEIQCDGPSGLSFVVTSSQHHLTLQTEFPSELCPLSEGLLVGGCCTSQSITVPILPHVCFRDNSTSQLEPSSGDPGNQRFSSGDPATSQTCREDSSTPVTSDSLSELTQAWTINDCDSVIDYLNELERSKLRLEFSLHFSASVMFTHDLVLLTPVRNDLTFSLTVKIQRATGVILSLSHSTTFSLYVHHVLQLYIGGEVYSTTLRPQLEVWSHIAIVYTSYNNRIDIYLTSTHQETVRGTVRLRSHFAFFEQAGYLALGSWLPGWSDGEVTALEGFSGFFGDLSTWNRAFTPGEIGTLWQASLPDDEDYLTHYWPLNEGEGNTAVDAMAGLELTMASGPWPQPEWVASDVPPAYGGVDLSGGQNGHLNESLQLCQRLFWSDPLAGACDQLMVSTKQMYLELCLDVADGAGDHEAYSVAFAYADICQVALNLTTWPAQPLCLEVPSLRSGRQCEDNCVNGIKRSGTCDCVKGFYGSACQYVCPGGLAAVCSDHGVCRSSGHCLCELNWKGTADCGTCAEDWVGEDCTVVEQSFRSVTILHRVYFTATITVHAQYIVFDGLLFYFGSVGEFYLVRTSTFTLQIRHVPCFSQGTCINAVAMNFHNDLIVFRAPYSTGQMPVLWLNGKHVDIYSITVEISHIWSLRQLSPGRYRFESSLDKNVVIDVQIIGLFMQLRIDLPDEICHLSEGLLGNCNGLTDDDLLELPTNTSQEAINDVLAKHWLVPAEESHFILTYGVYAEVSVPTGAGYSLRIANSGALTDPVNGMFGNVTAQSAFTLEFMVKVQEHKGVILSFYLDKTLTLLLDGTLKLSFGDQTFDTDIFFPLSSWSHIYLVVRASGLLQLYCYFDNGTTSAYRVSIHPFSVTMGTYILSLGQHIIQPAQDNILVVSSFTACDTAEELPTSECSNVPSSITTETYYNSSQPIGNTTTSCVFNGTQSDVDDYTSRFIAQDLFNSEYEASDLLLPQITVVWQQSTRTVEVYLFDQYGVAIANAVRLDPSTFHPGGHLVIGQWYTVIPLVAPNLPGGAFVGGIDEVRLWKRHSNPSVVIASWKFNGPSDTQGLEQAEHVCHNIFLRGLLHSRCKTLGSALLQLYYTQCLYDIAFHSDLDAAIQSTVAFGDICLTELSLYTWPAQYLCNAFPSREFSILDRTAV
ncbi:uncharacterized protein [Diadema antillarum]|uniref:uncharacterized protein n=1 Tax=Diadema antillarum TaxID=105358 RepID=UPI003A854B58